MKLILASLGFLAIAAVIPTAAIGSTSAQPACVLSDDEGGSTVSNPFNEDAFVEVFVNGRLVGSGVVGPCGSFDLPRDPATIGLPYEARFTPIGGGASQTVRGVIS